MIDNQGEIKTPLKMYFRANFQSSSQITRDPLPTWQTPNPNRTHYRVDSACRYAFSCMRLVYFGRAGAGRNKMYVCGRGPQRLKSMLFSGPIR